MCNHIYQYIATERIPTDQWYYGERIYVNEVITYCPLCHNHIRLSEEEWERYKEYCNKYPEESERLTRFDIDKVVSFTCENVLFNLNVIKNSCLNVPIKNIDQYYKRKEEK